MRHSVKRRDVELVLDSLKTEDSGDTLFMPRAVVDVLRWHRTAQAEDRMRCGGAYGTSGVVFASKIGKPLSRSIVRQGFNRVCRK